jgi:hypothetical protein
MSSKQHYLVIVVGDVEPELEGPFSCEDARDDAARRYRKTNGDYDGLYWLDIDGVPEIGAYSGAFFEKDDSNE